jgi:BASS family bile acid:Na+ symporter
MQLVLDVVVPAMTFTLLVAVGLDLTADDFARVGRQRLLVLTGLVAPVVLGPLVALGLVFLLQPAPDVAAGMLLVAACPIGNLSNTLSYLARASTALSVTLTALSCLFASLTIPLVYQGLALVGGGSVEFEVPFHLLVGHVLLVLALPVGLGMWMKRRAPARAARWSPQLQKLAFAGVGMVLILIIAAAPGAFVGGLSTTVPASVMFVAASMAVGWATAALVTGDRRDRFTIAVAVATRNVGVALAIAVTILGRVEFARFATAYFLTEIPLMLLVATFFRRHGSSLPQAPVTA